MSLGVGGGLAVPTGLYTLLPCSGCNVSIAQVWLAKDWLLFLLGVSEPIKKRGLPGDWLTQKRWGLVEPPRGGKKNPGDNLAFQKTMTDLQLPLRPQLIYFFLIQYPSIAPFAFSFLKKKSLLRLAFKLALRCNSFELQWFSFHKNNFYET